MRRRDFMKATAATVLIPALPSMAKPKIMTLEAFCRDVLKVKLTRGERQWVLYFFDPIFEPPIPWKHRTLYMQRAHLPTLPACVTLWAAYTHPKNIVWIHCRCNVYPQVMTDMAWDTGWDVWTAYVKHVWLADTHYPEARYLAKKPGDWHIYL